MRRMAWRRVFWRWLGIGLLAVPAIVEAGKYTCTVTVSPKRDEWLKVFPEDPEGARPTCTFTATAVVSVTNEDGTPGEELTEDPCTGGETDWTYGWGAGGADIIAGGGPKDPFITIRARPGTDTVGVSVGASITVCNVTVGSSDSGVVVVPTWDPYTPITTELPAGSTKAAAFGAFATKAAVAGAPVAAGGIILPENNTLYAPQEDVPLVGTMGWDPADMRVGAETTYPGPAQTAMGWVAPACGNMASGSLLPDLPFYDGSTNPVWRAPAAATAGIQVMMHLIDMAEDDPRANGTRIDDYLPGAVQVHVVAATLNASPEYICRQATCPTQLAWELVPCIDIDGDGVSDVAGTCRIELTGSTPALSGGIVLMDSVKRGGDSGTVTWDGTDAKGAPVPPGSYLFSLVWNAELDGHSKTLGALALVKVVEVDLDVDSLNDGGIGDEDDPDEDDASLPGKAVLANTLDSTANDVPDFADGLDRHGNSGTGRSCPFVPCVLSIPDFVDRSKARIQIDYSSADPAAVTVGGTPPEYGSGSANPLRLWRSDGPSDRKVAGVLAGGDFIAPGEYTAEEILTSGSTTTLYIEGINRTDPATARILVRLDPDGTSGYICEDAVRCTVGTLELDFRDITGADWPAGTNGMGIPRILANTEAQGAACDRLVDGTDGGALLLVRVLASPVLYAAAPRVTVGLGCIDSGAFSALPRHDGLLADLESSEAAFVASLGLQKAGEQLPDGRWVLKARKYEPPFEMDVNDLGNKEKERHVPLALNATGWATAHGARPYLISLVRAPLVLVHGINSSYERFYVDSGWVPEFESNFGFVCAGADHHLDSDGNGDVHDSYACVPTATEQATAGLRNGGSFPPKHIAVQKCDVVAHSYGGILARWYTEQSPDYDTRHDVRKLITMGTPHRGAPVTNVMCEAYRNALFFASETGGSVPTAWGDGSLGATLNHFNGQPAPHCIRWHTGGNPPNSQTQGLIVRSLQVLSVGSQVVDLLNATPLRDEISYGAVVGYDEHMEVYGPLSMNAHVTLQPRYDMPADSLLFDRSYFPWISVLDGGNQQSDGIVPKWSQTLPSASQEVNADHIEYNTHGGTREQVRAWLNDPSLPKGDLIRAQWAVPAGDASRRNAYVGSAMTPVTGYSVGAGVNPQAIVRITACELATAGEFTPTPGGGVLGSRGGILRITATGMVDSTESTLGVGACQGTRVAEGIGAGAVGGGELVPFQVTTAGCFGRTLGGKLVGAQGTASNTNSASLERWYVTYRTDCANPDFEVESPPCVIDIPPYLLPPVQGPATAPPLPSYASFTVQGGVPCSVSPPADQSVAIMVNDRDTLSPDDLLHQAAITVSVPGCAFADVLLPYSFSLVRLFRDGDGYLAGVNGSSGEACAQVYQELVIPGSTSNPTSAPVAVEVEP